jgi:tripartite ATP-independent transporter DctM subunit
MSSMTVGIIGFVFVLSLILFIKIPIGFAMTIVGVAGIAYLTSFGTAAGVLGGQIFVSAASYDMAVVAMFILMGELAFATGISDKAYEAAFKWVGKLRGGLTIATIAACGAFAAVCGSSPATAATVGSVALPEMKKYGYNDDLATGSIAAGGVLGILIPPSMGFILIGLLTEQSISKLYMAGIVPGILLMLLFMFAAYIVVMIRPQGIPVPSYSLKEKLTSLKGILDVLIIFLIVIGGLFYGFFSPTEAGAVGAFIIVIISLIKKTFSWQKLFVSIGRSTVTSGMIIIIYIGAKVFSYFLAASSLPFRLGGIIANLPLSPILIMGAILILWLILGCLMDAIAMIMLTVPVIFPIIIQLGLDPIWFGVLGVLAIEAGLITPPIGMNVYVIAGVAKDVPVSTIFRGIIPFFLAVVFCIILIMAFPKIALFLPSIL